MRHRDELAAQNHTQALALAAFEQRLREREAALEQRLRERNASLGQLAIRLSEVQHEVAAIKASTVWRATGPLRTLIGWIRRLFRTDAAP